MFSCNRFYCFPIPFLQDIKFHLRAFVYYVKDFQGIAFSRGVTSGEWNCNNIFTAYLPGDDDSFNIYCFSKFLLNAIMSWTEFFPLESSIAIWIIALGVFLRLCDEKALSVTNEARENL